MFQRSRAIPCSFVSFVGNGFALPIARDSGDDGDSGDYARFRRFPITPNL